MISDARKLPSGAALSADVCIAGGGAAGITLLLALVDAGLSVCLLESGGFDLSDANQALYEGGMTGIDARPLDKVRARVFGGSTELWAGWCRPLAREDFEPRSWIPESGWPFGYDDLWPYYGRAHDSLELGPVQYDPEVLSKLSDQPLLPLDPRVLETRAYQFSPSDTFRNALPRRGRASRPC